MKVLIVQSIPTWLNILRNAISKKFPDLNVIYTDSFDQALFFASTEKPKFIVTSNWFHDKLSTYVGPIVQKIDDDKKSGNLLAKMVKEMDPKIEVFSFSEFVSPDREYLDGYIVKSNDTNSSGKDGVYGLSEIWK